jgi:hypothetical protein
MRARHEGTRLAVSAASLREREIDHQSAGTQPAPRAHSVARATGRVDVSRLPLGHAARMDVGRRTALVHHFQQHLGNAAVRAMLTRTERARPGEAITAAAPTAAHPFLQRDTATVRLHPEDSDTFYGSLKLPSGGLFAYAVELNNVTPLLLDRANRPKLDLQVQAGIGDVLRDLLKTKEVLSGLPQLRLSLDAGFSKALNEGHVEALVKRAARAEIHRLVVQSRKAATVVLDAILNIMSIDDYVFAGPVVLLPEMQPRYYINDKKTVTEDGDVKLLWEWFQIANDVVTDKIARARIEAAVAHTAPLIARLNAEGGDKTKMLARYAEKVARFTQRAAREEVDEMIAAGFAASQRGGGTAVDAGDAAVSTAAARGLAVFGEIAEVMHRLTEEHTTANITKDAAEVLRERSGYYEHLREYLRQVFKENKLADDPDVPLLRRAAGMSVPDGLALLKGGLDAVSAIMAVKDPETRKKLFEARSGALGIAGQTADISAVCLKLVSGTVAFGGATVYGMAKLAGNAELAEKALDFTTNWVGHIAGALHAVAIIHSMVVLLDPKASRDEKAEAAVQGASSAIGLAGYISRWVPRLAGAARWSGPIAASLAINFAVFKRLAGLRYRAQVGLSRLDWVSCYQSANAAAVEAQIWMRRLAVADALLAAETDAPRKAELTKAASAFRSGLVEEQMKPFVEARLSSKSADDDSASCGIAFNRRLKPMQGLLPTAATSDDAALGAAAVFLNIIETAFNDWDQIVMERQP